MPAILCLLLTTLLLATAAGASADQILQEMLVRDRPEQRSAGTTALTAEELALLPAPDQSITALLRLLPGVQLAEDAYTANNGGEILPPEISISGGRVYDNRFLIDGLGNDSLLDPLAGAVDDESAVPGHSQELFLDRALLGNLTLYRSNVPARYSGFTGGVVEVETRDPGQVFAAELNYRTTRSSWTEFHVDAAEREDFEHSTSADQQPDFTRHNARLLLDLPLGPRSGVLLSYGQQYSRIPLYLLEETQNQYRRQENLFVKYRLQPHEGTELSLTGLWTPYQGHYFLKDTRNSGFDIEGGGLALNARFKQRLRLAEVEVQLGFKRSENSRRAPADFYAWALTPSKDWGTLVGGKISKEGGYGDIEQLQDSLSLALHSEFVPWQFAGFAHHFSTGLRLEQAQASYERTEPHRYYYYRADTGLVCPQPSVECLAGEQFVYYRKDYAADEADADIALLELYLEDRLERGRWTLRPGLNYSYNDLTGNNDYAGRLALFYDLFGDRSTLLSGGINRYYGKTLLTYALREEIAPYDRWNRSTRLTADGTPAPWPASPSERIVTASRLASLKTPRVDELTLGLEQELLGGLLCLAYIDRNGEDLLGMSQLDKDDSNTIYSEWNNNGESRHREVTLSWQRQWTRHYLLLDATWQDSEASNEDYDDLLRLEELEELVWYNGQVTQRIGLPRSDYNREWSANLIYRVELPAHFSFTNTTRYRSGYNAIVDSGDNYELPDGSKIDIYQERSLPSATLFDWALQWHSPLVAHQRLTLTLELFNVFNKKVYTAQTGVYQPGRQLWVEANWAF